LRLLFHIICACNKKRNKCAFNGHSEMLSDSTQSQRNTFDQIDARTGSVKHQHILSVIFVRAYDFQSLAMLFINQEVLQLCLKMAVPRTDRETERSSWKPDFTMISLTACLKTHLQSLNRHCCRCLPLKWSR
jgi:hypothetical protein